MGMLKICSLNENVLSSFNQMIFLLYSFTDEATVAKYKTGAQ